VIAVQRTAALIFGLGFFEPAGGPIVVLLVAGDEHRQRLARLHLADQRDRGVQAPEGEYDVDQGIGAVDIPRGPRLRIQDLRGQQSWIAKRRRVEDALALRVPNWVEAE
jgi:hypothetical protein